MSKKITVNVKRFNTEKGCGFIDGPDGDVFIHYRSILEEGDRVEFIHR